MNISDADESNGRPDGDSPAPTVDVVVPVYGGWEHTRRCLRALLDQTAPCRLVVVDDLSPDDTADRIAAEFPSVELIRNPVNLGFARACNVGMRHGSGDIVLLVNSDVEARPDMVSTIARRFEDADSRVGSMATLLLQPNGLVDSFGIVADATGAGYVRYHGAQLSHASAVEPPVLGPYGAVAAYRRSALEEVGMFDENIFMYGEELDLALRLRSGSWGCEAIPSVVGTHIGGLSAGIESDRQRYLSGFARGYVLRVYGVFASRQAVRALATEILVLAVRALARHDITSARGRIAGWRRGRGVPRRRVPQDGVDASIGFRRSLRMRSATYWQTIPEPPVPRGATSR